MQTCMGIQIDYSGNSIGRTKYLPQQTILSGLSDTISFVLHDILTTDATIHLTQQTTFPGLKDLTYTLPSFHCIHHIQLATLSIIDKFNIRLYHYLL